MSLGGDYRLSRDLVQRMRFFLDLTATRALCEPQAIDQLESALDHLDSREGRDFLLGYRLAVACPLFGVADLLINNADLLGLEHDDGLANWWNFRDEGRIETILSAASKPKSRNSVLCSKLVSSVVALRNAKPSLNETATALDGCQDFASIFNHVISDCEVISIDNREIVEDRDEALRRWLGERVLEYVYDAHIAQRAYETFWRGYVDTSPLHDNFVLEAETDIELIPNWSFESTIPHRWVVGLIFGLDSTLRASGVHLADRHIEDLGDLDANSWFKELNNFVKTVHSSNAWPSQRYGLSKFSSHSFADLNDSLGAHLPPVSPRERLSALMGQEPVRLISSNDATGFLDFEILLTGLASLHSNAPVQVVLMKHTDRSDDIEWVSIGVRHPIYGIFSNASKWYMFYKMYHEGFVTDSEVGVARVRVRETLSRLDSFFEIEELLGLNSDDLLQRIQSVAFREMRDLSQRAVDINSELRAGNAELLAAFWWQNQGYSNVKVSFKDRQIGDFEYDVVGVKGGQCLIGEVKAGEILDDELRNEIDRFSNKIEHLRYRLSDLARALGYDGEILSVDGVFISSNDFDGFQIESAGLCLWDYDRFVKELKSVGLNNRIIRLLERSMIIRTVTEGDR